MCVNLQPFITSISKIMYSILVTVLPISVCIIKKILSVRTFTCGGGLRADSHVLLAVDDKSMLRYIRDKTAAPYFSNLVWFIGNHVLELDACVRHDIE